MTTREQRRKAAKDVLDWSRRVSPEKMLWQCDTNEAVIQRLRVMLDASVKREEWLERHLAAKPKPKPCAKCKQRKKLAVLNRRKSLEKPAAENIKAVIANIVECWPDFKRVPWLQWNLYLDATGTCRCGRKIAPQRIMAGAKTCCDQCQEKKKKCKDFARKFAWAKQHRQMSEGMGDV